MTNLRISVFWLLLGMTAMWVSSCNDPSDIGSVLVEEQFSDIRFTDTVTINAVTIPQDSIFTYTRIVANQPNSYLCGYLDDPLFGKSQATIYFDLGPVLNSSLVDLDFSQAVFDSLVLSLSYNPLLTYGDTLKPQNLRVYRVSEEMYYNEEYYYSNHEFECFPTPIGEKLSFLPQPNTVISEISTEDTLVKSPHIRIMLDPDLATELMPVDVAEAEALYENDQTFREVFRGIKIESDASGSNILGFNLRYVLSYMRIYYTVDEEQKTFTLQAQDPGVKFNHFDHDYSGSIVEGFINNEEASDSLVFAQGMSGTNIKVDFPYIKDIQNVVVNKAELELTFADLMEDDTSTYDHPARIVLTRLDEDGNLVFIEDVSDALSLGSINLYGGTELLGEENGLTLRKYKLNISNHLQDIIDNRLGGNDSVYIQVYLKNQYAYRGVFFGPGHSRFPLKLNLAYTQL